MTNKEAISNLGQLYPVVSEEMKRAIDKAIEALDLTGKAENNDEQKAPNNCCRNCKYSRPSRYDNILYCDLRNYTVSKDDNCFHFGEASHD